MASEESPRDSQGEDPVRASWFIPVTKELAVRDMALHCAAPLEALPDSTTADRVPAVVERYGSEVFVAHVSWDSHNATEPVREGMLLHIASWNGRPETVRAMLDAGASLDAEDLHGRQPLHVASERGQEEVARVLLERGARPDATDRLGRTALHLAAECGDPDLISVLVDAGASVGARDVYQSTPLHQAARESRVACVEKLLQKGADCTSKDSDGRMPADEVGHDLDSQRALLEALEVAEHNVDDALARLRILMEQRD